MAGTQVADALPRFARIEALRGGTPRPHARRLCPLTGLQRVGRFKLVGGWRVPVHRAEPGLVARECLAAPNCISALAPAKCTRLCWFPHGADFRIAIVERLVPAYQL